MCREGAFTSEQLVGNDTDGPDVHGWIDADDAATGLKCTHHFWRRVFQGEAEARVTSYIQRRLSRVVQSTAGVKKTVLGNTAGGIH